MLLALSVYETSVILCYWQYLCMKQVWYYVTGTICVLNKCGIMLLALSVYETNVVFCHKHFKVTIH
jgi:hypothetical protein